MADIFISYAREDASVTERLATVFEGHGWSVFWDRRIPTGVRYDTFIAERLAEARAVVALWSRAACASAWVVDEAADANRRGALLPAMIEAIEPPLGLRRVNAADLVGWSGDPAHPGLQRLIADLGRLLGAEGKAETPPANIAAPPPAVPTVEGRWQGEVSYPWGLRRTETFVFVAMGGTLAGTAGFLGVPRSIVEGAVDGTGVRFAARTREAAGSEERMATRRWVGRLNGDALDLMLTTEGGFSDHEPVSMSLRRVPA